MRAILLIVVVAFGLPGFNLHAQVTNFSIFKVTVYNQNSPALPTAPDVPNAYYFGAQLNSLDASDYVDVYANVPGADSIYFDESAPNYFTFNSPYFADKTDFDSSYPSGEYDFYVDFTNSTDSGSIIVPSEELYATNVATFATNCWLAMQQVDPTQPLTLNWNSFTPSPGATTAYTFIDILDQDTGETPFAADFLTPGTMTTNIPANTLLYGKTYRVNAFFSNRQDTPDAGFGGALGTVGFDNLTYTTLVTIPPWLHIAPANNQEVTVTWPALISNFELQENNSLGTDDVGWITLTNVPVTMCGTNSVTLPASDGQEFFRLTSFSY
jgi:hypothetical protein